MTKYERDEEEEEEKETKQKMKSKSMKKKKKKKKKKNGIMTMKKTEKGSLSSKVKSFGDATLAVIGTMILLAQVRMSSQSGRKWF